MKLFHFKVLELKQVQHPPKPTKKEPNLLESCLYEKEKFEEPLEAENKPASECSVKYHFFHRLMSRYNILDRDEEGKKKKEQENAYDWNCNGENIRQRLYLNDDAKQMIEVIQDRIAILWRHEN